MMNKKSFLHLLCFSSFVLFCQSVKAENGPFYYGVDLSYTNQMEDCGATFAAKKKPQSTFELFHDVGANLVRVRLFHTPEWTSYSTLADVKKTIRRSKALGMKVLLDFHYSDNWAHPGQQVIPKAWSHISDTNLLAKELYDYTYSVLMELHAEGLMPEMVQVGNETNTEILLDKKESDSDEIIIEEGSSSGINWPRNARLLNAGIKAVRDVSAQLKTTTEVMLHIAQPENVEAWFEQAAVNGIVDYDLIGISYYPKWSDYSMQELAATINRVRHRFDKDVIVVEVSYAWTDGWQDTTTNILGSTSAIKGYPITKKGQRKYLIDLTQAIITSGGSGIVYWGADYVSTKCKNRWGVGSSWENATLFDYGKYHRLLPAVAFIRHKYEFPQEVTFSISIEDERFNEDQPIYLWGDFLGSNKFVVPVFKQGDSYVYKTKVMSGDRFRYQLYADAALNKKLIDAPSGFAQAEVKGKDVLLEHKVK